MSKLAYITSGKIGLPRFTYNELVELNNRDIGFILCLTQLHNGPWLPKTNWNTIVFSFPRACFALLILLFTKPLILASLVQIAFSHKVLPYLLIACSFFLRLRKENVTSIHCQMGDKKLYAGVFLKFLLMKPLTTTIHAHELYQRTVYDRPAQIKWLYANCDEVITISDFNAQLIVKQFEVDPVKITVMRLSPDIDPERKLMGKKKILVVANWAEKKGFTVLIDAVKEMKRSDFVILIVGGTYNSSNSIQVDEIVKKNNLGDRFIFLGRQGGYTLDLIFDYCDIFCLPSYTEYFDDGNPAEREGIPVALMEAMAWGKPVISTRHAGIPELVDKVLIDERNTEQLKDALNYLLDNPDKWEEMGRRNKAIIAEKYSTANINILIDIFKKW